MNPRFTKVIIDYFMTRKPSISRRNRIHWHYVRDDALFSTIKVVSRHQATQQYGAILPIELTTAEMRNKKAYQEYYACAMGESAPKPKASAIKKKGDSASSTTPPTPTPTTIDESAPRLGSGTGEGTGSKPGVPDVPSDDSEEELLWKSSDDEEVGSHEEGKESDDDSDKGSDNDFDETVKFGAGVESICTTTSSPIVSLEPPTPEMTPSTIATITTSVEAPIPPPTIPSIILENL
nr:hypothetical protein [Tanacetum cinerariifolium]